MNEHTLLPLPQVPATLADGLLPTSALNRALQVQIPIWESMQTGYFVQLMLDGQLVGETKTKAEEDVVGGYLDLYLSIECFWRDGTYLLAYRATNDRSEQHNDSPAIRISVDRTAPGAALLAPMIFQQINFGDALTGQVPGYAHMAVGDTLTTLCNGVQGPVYQVSQEDLSERAIQIHFSREFLQSLQSSAISMTYQVTDRAGNQSRLASPVTLSMHG